MKKYIDVIKNKPYFKPFVFFVLFITIATLGVTFTRFIIEKVRDYRLESKNFYFNSNRLKKGNAFFQINNWSGVGDFPIDITVTTRKNYLVSLDYDVTYTISYTCSNDVTCVADKSNSIVYNSSNTDTFSLVVTPNKVFAEGESTTVHIEAKSTHPYVETISADFQIVVGKRGVTYSIDDEANRPYLLMSITNALTYYTVKQAFDSYQVGDEIDVSTYKSLSQTNKNKCQSVEITLNFDPNVVLLDITSSIFAKSVTNDITISGTSYVNEMTFPMDALSSIEVRFYKKNHTLDYTYPFENNTSVINFTAN